MEYLFKGAVGASAKFLSKYENKYIFYIVTLLILFNCIWHALGKCIKLLQVINYKLI